MSDMTREERVAHAEKNAAILIEHWHQDYGVIVGRLCAALGMSRTEVMLFMLWNTRNLMIHENRNASDKHSKEVADWMARWGRVLEWQEREMDQDDDWKGEGEST